jgi:hypothetical protein
MSFRDDIATASNATINSAGWIHFFNGAIILFAIIGAPFTMFTSLLTLLAIPFNSALAAIAVNGRRQTELSRLHLMLLADLHNLD